MNEETWEYVAALRAKARQDEEENDVEDGVEDDKMEEDAARHSAGKLASQLATQPAVYPVEGVATTAREIHKGEDAMSLTFAELVQGAIQESMVIVSERDRTMQRREFLDEFVHDVEGKVLRIVRAVPND